ncbi:conserved hypothetical protein [Sulfolobus islandicus Y.G.57.14]|jgi:RsiW-degrading membrane proteinase PrsW (M82 family)|uniref:Uncharacterized protein n=14 Tax=Saccharolobus TaxID=2100760 RepID=Q7LXJ5_SACS2|nr:MULTISPECIES: hypothetical protein [Sulfolobaceae]AAK41072.1 Hypothetical protein SSO0775 [Saccharolobus solfataricus P2]ACP35468.1 conserved hypothetical protein [Sulfolobus islandicus L.S.2.15]ACP38119.1 conserved hypothetical protein [Sulfolobus islandicus M.14.25]ACP45626.1 conserved hypothetical protein [Sulfolobus islandicus Y.G.57.14]ACP48572.1 conserved hypothetical protein [Sulfolobus islandicus Y.N.15.51]
MPKKYNRLYNEVINSYVILILIFILIIGILGVIAFPYYISPLNNGQALNSAGYLALGVIIIIFLLLGVYFMERNEHSLGAMSILISLIILVLAIWSIYGINAVKSIFGI